MVDESTLIISLLVSIVALGIISEIMFHKFRIPEPIVLLTLGLLIQYSGIIPGGQGTLDYLRAIAPILGTIVLGLVLLDAGLGMRAYDMLVRSPKVLALALLEPITTALGFSAIMYLAFGWPLIYGAIFGALLATTTGEVIVPLLRSIKTDEGTENTLILDSVYNSVTTIVIFQVLFDFVSSPTSLSFSSWQIKDIEIQLDSNVAKDYNMKHTFGKTVISLKTSYIQGVGDKIIVRYTSDELGRLIASAATS